MDAKEAELVTDEFVKLDSNYNLCPGGDGGFGYVNSNRLWDTPQRQKAALVNLQKRQIGNERWRNSLDDVKSREWSNSVSGGLTEHYKTNPGHMLGKKHSEETKLKMRDKKIRFGEKNSQYGKQWITNGSQNKKIYKTEEIPYGWARGRILNREIL